MASTTKKPATIRAEPHPAVGEVIQRDAGVILQRWAMRAKEEQPSAKRVHHDVLLDHLQTFLWDLGRSLSEAGDPHPDRHARPAEVHGDERWHAGWSINEVVRDYLILRIVLVDYLEETLERPLESRETLALGVAVDDAIAASVAAYTSCLVESVAEGSGEKPGFDSDGLYNVLGFLGHELRNPLAPLGNAIQILRVVKTPEQIEEARHLMERQLRVMTRIVEDLMDFPRLARGKLSLKRQRLDLAQIIKECVDDRRIALADAGLGLRLELPDTPIWTSGDETRLAQVVGNLLHNAQKFTDRGGEILVRLNADPTRRLAEIMIRDTGIGIEAVFLPRVFETFMQADRSVDRSRGGIGLGLALVKGIVELHGGTVAVASDGPGQGAEFRVELPLLELPREGSAPADSLPNALISRRVLIIEDNRDSADSLRMYLELVGHRVNTAYSGPDGLKAASAQPPDVIICDIGLPRLSGDVICAELRKDPAFARTLLVALSGHDSHGIREKALAAGVDIFLVKPVDPNVVAQLVLDHKPTRS